MGRSTGSAQQRWGRDAASARWGGREAGGHSSALNSTPLDRMLPRTMMLGSSAQGARFMAEAAGLRSSSGCISSRNRPSGSSPSRSE